MAQLKLKSAPTSNAFNTTLNGAISNTATTITLNSVTGLQNKAGILVIDRQDSDGIDTPTKREYIYFTSVSGSSVVLPSVADGRGQGGSSALGHADGALVESVMDVDQWNGLVDSYAVQHADAGTHTALTSDTLGLSSNASIGGSLFAGRANLLSTASVGGIVNSLVGVNIASTASGYYQQGLPLIRAGAEGILRLSQIRYQSITTNSTQENVLVQAGWSFINNDGTEASGITITFPTAFDTVLAVIATPAGALGSDPTVITDGTTVRPTDAIQLTLGVNAITTTNFNVIIKRTAASSGERELFSWIAFGIKA